MLPKKKSKRSLFLVYPLGVILFVALLLVAILLSFIPKNSPQSSSASLIENVAILSNQEEANTELPKRLKIPVIGVDSAIISVGITSDGAMDVPKGPEEVAWFNLGPLPGENGSAVIAGHYDWKNNIPAVFDNLYKLHIGDKIFVEYGKGISASFVVREIRIYGKDDVASDVFVSSDGNSHLNLITCTGIWNRVERTFSNRLIIFTDKE